MLALIAEEVDFVGTITSATRSAIAGFPIVVVATVSTAPNHTLVARREIRSIKDLKGKKIGVSGFKGMTDVATRLALKKYGVNPDDTKILAVRSTPARLAALKGGGIDATFLSLPYNKMALKLGFRELMRGD